MRYSVFEPLLPVGLGPGLARWALALGWWLALGWPLRRGLRSALGGLATTEALAAGPPTRPRRPKAARSRPGRPPLPL